MTLAWFRKPNGDDPGTSNLAYSAVDLPVIRGLASEPAVLGARSLDFATLLAEVGAVAGAYRGLGVAPGSTVGGAVADPQVELLAFLAAVRLGAVYVDLGPLGPRGLERVAEHRPHLVVADHRIDFAAAGHTPASVLLVGPDPVDETIELPWEIAVRAGRTDPAGCEPVPVGSTAYVLDTEVCVAPEPADDRFGRAIAALAAGKPVDLAAGAVR